MADLDWDHEPPIDAEWHPDIEEDEDSIIIYSDPSLPHYLLR